MLFQETINFRLLLLLTESISGLTLRVSLGHYARIIELDFLISTLLFSIKYTVKNVLKATPE